MVSKSYTTPVRIVPAELTVDGETRDVYLVALLKLIVLPVSCILLFILFICSVISFNVSNLSDIIIS